MKRGRRIRYERGGGEKGQREGNFHQGRPFTNARNTLQEVLITTRSLINPPTLFFYGKWKEFTFFLTVFFFAWIKTKK